MNKMNDLFVLRHGKATNAEFAQDFERVLTDTGIEQAEKIGDWMFANNLNPDRVLTSSAKRALMTTRIVTEKLNVAPEKVQLASEIYNANLDVLLEVLANSSAQDRKILLVGHNPSLENLVDYLLSATITHELENDGRLFPASLVHLEMNVDWSQLSPYCAQLVSITHGKFLS